MLYYFNQHQQSGSGTVQSIEQQQLGSGSGLYSPASTLSRLSDSELSELDDYDDDYNNLTANTNNTTTTTTTNTSRGKFCFNITL